ncbi:unnamed protein product [Diplocarpon coronariae]
MPANSFPGPNFRPESVHAEGKLLSPQRELPISQRPDARRKRKDRTDGLPASTPPAGGPRAVGGAWSARVSGLGDARRHDATRWAGGGLRHEDGCRARIARAKNARLCCFGGKAGERGRRARGSTPSPGYAGSLSTYGAVTHGSLSRDLAKTSWPLSEGFACFEWGGSGRIRWFQSAGLYGKPEMFEAMEGGQSSQAPLRALDPTGGDSLSNGFDRVVYKTLTMVQRRQEREEQHGLIAADFSHVAARNLSVCLWHGSRGDPRKLKRVTGYSKGTIAGVASASIAALRWRQAELHLQDANWPKNRQRGDVWKDSSRRPVPRLALRVPRESALLWQSLRSTSKYSSFGFTTHPGKLRDFLDSHGCFLAGEAIRRDQVIHFAPRSVSARASVLGDLGKRKEACQPPPTESPGHDARPCRGNPQMLESTRSWASTLIATRVGESGGWEALGVSLVQCAFVADLAVAADALAGTFSAAFEMPEDSSLLLEPRKGLSKRNCLALLTREFLRSALEGGSHLSSIAELCDQQEYEGFSVLSSPDIGKQARDRDLETGKRSLKTGLCASSSGDVDPVLALAMQKHSHWKAGQWLGHSLHFSHYFTAVPQ